MARLSVLATLRLSDKHCAQLLTEWAANIETHPKKKTNTKFSPHLSHHAVPRSVDLLAMFAISDQVKVIGELDRLGDLLQDVNAEALTAALYVDP